jgi:hypothetical protein
MKTVKVQLKLTVEVTLDEKIIVKEHGGNVEEFLEMVEKEVREAVTNTPKEIEKVDIIGLNFKEIKE